MLGTDREIARKPARRCPLVSRPGDTEGHWNGRPLPEHSGGESGRLATVNTGTARKCWKFHPFLKGVFNGTATGEWVGGFLTGEHHASPVTQQFCS